MLGIVPIIFLDVPGKIKHILYHAFFGFSLEIITIKNMADEWYGPAENWFDSVEQLLPDFGDLLERCASNLDNTERIVENILSELAESKELCDFFYEIFCGQYQSVSDKLAELIELFSHYEGVFKCIQDTKKLENSSFEIATLKTGKRGRPKCLVNDEQVFGLLSLGISLKKIAEMLGISYKTLYRHRKRNGTMYECRKYDNVTDEEINGAVGNLLRDNPLYGERMVFGALLSIGIKVQRWRVRNAIKIINPNPIGLKKRKIFRRTYNVPCANALW